MKKYYIVFICIVLILSICGCSVSLPADKPKEGIWYCEELKMSIDFSMIAKFEPDCIKQYADDGTYTVLRCYTDQTDDMYICTPDQKTWHYYGEFKYKDDIFIYSTFEGDTYYFVRLEEDIEISELFDDD